MLRTATNIKDKIFARSIITVYATLLSIAACLLFLYITYKTMYVNICNEKGILEQKICQYTCLLFAVLIWMTLFLSMITISNMIMLHRLINKKQPTQHDIL